VIWTCFGCCYVARVTRVARFRDERLFRRHLLKVVFSDDVDGFQEHIAGRRFEPTYPQFEMTRRDFESAGEFFLAAGDFGGPLERPCVNRWQLNLTSRGDLSPLPNRSSSISHSARKTW